MIPLWLWIRVSENENGKRRLALPIPIFLLWIVLVALLLMLAPLVLLAGLILLPFGWGRPLFGIYGNIFLLLGSMSGLSIDIESRRQHHLTRILLK